MLSAREVVFACLLQVPLSSPPLGLTVLYKDWNLKKQEVTIPSTSTLKTHQQNIYTPSCFKSTVLC